MRAPEIQLFDDELVIDSFAGGGGASTGIEWAIGRSPDIAINHDPEALRMHEANHPKTVHICSSVYDADPEMICAGRKVGLAWFSPDCTHHSKARGGKPRSKNIRALADIIPVWAEKVRPRVIGMENVEEWKDWGPLDKDGHPIAGRKGEYFRRWLRRMKRAGYEVEMRELRACDYGAPTIRKRLFIIARCDGVKITWPEPSHGPKASKPYRTAAECIDWNIPCPSIFERSKPLADKTCARIARGIVKYVMKAQKPFIVPLTHAGDVRVHDVDEPMRTITGANRGEMAVITPTLVGIDNGSNGNRDTWRVDEPTRTIVTENRLAVVAPTMIRTDMHKSNAGCAYPPGDPLRTVTSGGGHALVGATLVQTSWGERPGQAPRVPHLDKPLGTVMAGGGKHALVTAFLAKHYAGFNVHPGQAVDAPAGTITTQDHHALVTSHLVKLKGTCADGQPVTNPAATICAGGFHLGEVRAFLIKYYGTGEGQMIDGPLGTVTTKDRFALVVIEGVEYAIVDIGMRMLTPRELFLAQGFPSDYDIDCVANGEPMTKTEQIAKCGNSVSPPVAEAIVRSQLLSAREKAA